MPSAFYLEAFVTTEKTQKIEEQEDEESRRCILRENEDVKKIKRKRSKFTRKKMNNEKKNRYI